MQIALVIGSTIATVKDEAIYGRKLLNIRKADTIGNMTGDPFVAMASVSAGASARITSQTYNYPVDAVIAGAIGSVELGREVTFRKE